MRKATDTKVKLMETATRLIWESNYDGVGVAEICKQAGVTKGAFYHYFETKADLFCESAWHHWGDLRKEFDEVLSPTHEPIEQLENYIHFVIRRQEEDAAYSDQEVAACPFFTSGSQMGVDNVKVRNMAIEMADQALKYNRALVRNLKAVGALEGEADELQTARLLKQFLQGLFTYARVYGDLNIIRRDLRPGLYRLLNLKAEFFREPSAREQIVEREVA